MPLSWLEDLWRRLKRVDPLRPGVFVWMAVMPTAAVILYDGQQFGFDNPRFWIASGITYPIFALSYFLAMLPFSKLPSLRNSAIGKLVVILLLFTARTVAALAIILQDWSLLVEEILERTPGDLSAIVVMWGAVATVSTANLDYRNSLGELNRVAADLESHRQTRAEAAAKADRTLRQKAISALHDELESISQELRATNRDQDFWRLSVEIKSLVENKVRPLSKELRNRIDLLTKASRSGEKSLQRTSVFLLPISPRQDIRFTIAYVVASVNIFVTVLQLSDLSTALMIQAVSLSFPAIAMLLGSMRSVKARTSFGGAIAWATLVTVLAYLPTLWILNSSVDQFGALARIQLTAFFLIYVLLLAFSGWSTLQRARQEHLQMIADYNEEIRRELALIDQALWVAQRKWSYLIHGTVQGALTVASSRLIFHEKPDQQVVEQATNDLKKAKAALQSPAEFNQSTEELILEIVASWRGVCEVRFEFSKDALVRLDQSESGKTCAIELAKELVSNAFRHGKAGSVWISGFINEAGDLRLIGTNDGSPVASDFAPGLGFAMFDELTIEWFVDSTPEPRIVATIPLARGQADQT